MGHPLSEKRILGGDFIKVGIEMIAADTAKIDDICLGHRAPVGDQGFADAQVLKVLHERVYCIVCFRSPGMVFVGNGHQRGRRPLQCRPLHVVLDGPGATQFLTAAGTSRTAVDKIGQGRTVTRRLPGTVPIDHQHATVPGRTTEYEGFRLLIIPGKNRTHQGAFAPACQCHSVFDGGIRHDRGHRPEGLHRVDFLGDERLIAAQQGRGIKSAGIAIQSFQRHVFVTASDNPCLAGQLRHPGTDVLCLLGADQRTQTDLLQSGVTGGGLFQAGSQCRLDCVDGGFGDNDPANGRAFLTGLDRHFPGDLLDEQVKFLVTGLYRRPEDGTVQGIRFHGEWNTVGEQVRVVAQTLACGCRAGEGHHVLLVQMLQQVPGAATDQLNSPFGQGAQVNHGRYHRLGQVGGCRCRLDNDRHARRDTGCQFLQHPPDREVVGIDVDGHAVLGRQDMTTHETTFTGQALHVTFHHNHIVGKFPGDQTGVAEHRTDAAFDVRPGIGPCGAGPERQIVEVLL